MEKKKLQSVSIAALIVSILPLAALAPSLLHLSLSDGVRTAWAGAHIVPYFRSVRKRLCAKLENLSGAV